MRSAFGPRRRTKPHDWPALFASALPWARSLATPPTCLARAVALPPTYHDRGQSRRDRARLALRDDHDFASDTRGRQNKERLKNKKKTLEAVSGSATRPTCRALPLVDDGGPSGGLSRPADGEGGGAGFSTATALPSARSSGHRNSATLLSVSGSRPSDLRTDRARGGPRRRARPGGGGGGVGARGARPGVT
ncbi:hypothetical protein CDD83_3562 [Cordyceps sp. RAO-2017]|nr:hypothetical protein CDD83_3562 [Cordyceps sp. RAO-2017]